VTWRLAHAGIHEGQNDKIVNIFFFRANSVMPKIKVISQEVALAIMVKD